MVYCYVSRAIDWQSREDMAAETWGGWSHCILQSRNRGRWRLALRWTLAFSFCLQSGSLVYRLVHPTFRLWLPTFIKPLWKPFTETSRGDLGRSSVVPNQVDCEGWPSWVLVPPLLWQILNYLLRLPSDAQPVFLPLPHEQRSRENPPSLCLQHDTHHTVLWWFICILGGPSFWKQNGIESFPCPHP